MHFHHIPWALVLLECVKLLKAFGLIPGVFAAYGVRRLYQKWRQKRAMEGWPATEARVWNASVHTEGARNYWADITYSYYVDEYRAGKYVRRFRRKEEALEFVRQMRDKRVQVHYDSVKPDTSVILDRDMEMIALLAPQVG